MTVLKNYQFQEIESELCIQDLEKVIKEQLPNLLKQHEAWETLVINRRKPYTYRAFTMLENGRRLCLHRFECCDENEAFLHPHPWDGAFKVLKGSYWMNVGYSQCRESFPNYVMKSKMVPGSVYTMTNPMTWHSVTPIEECYTVMLNYKPYDENYAHTQVRTTRGKDLNRMTLQELDNHLETFQKLLDLANF